VRLDHLLSKEHVVPQVCGVMLENVFLSVFLNKSRFFVGFSRWIIIIVYVKAGNALLGVWGSWLLLRLGPS